MSDGTTSLGEALVAVIAVGTLPVGILTAMFVGLGSAAVVFVVGWLLLVPVVAILQDTLGEPDAVDEAVSAAVTDAVSNRTDDTDEADDPLETLRQRYAAGELDEAEFERKVERLLETEGIDVPEGATETFDGAQATSTGERTDENRNLDRE